VVHFESREDKPLVFYAGEYRQLRAEKERPPQWPAEDEFSLFSIGNIDPPITLNIPPTPLTPPSYA